MGPEGFAIVIVDRGFVHVGRVEWINEWCVIREARNIRRWGTTKGLGELALNGPTPDTILDAWGTVQVPMGQVISILETESHLWTR